jgi:hypothetical protein
MGIDLSNMGQFSFIFKKKFKEVFCAARPALP